jgi:cyclic pyranopterin phosphate synthase
LRPATVEAIKQGKVEKGDVLETAKVAAMLAVKHTPHLQPYCHNIPIDAVKVAFELEKDGVWANVSVKATAKTGAEMEAIIGVQNALSAIWDMTKYLEKDATGNYPTTTITDVKVTEKRKG